MLLNDYRLYTAIKLDQVLCWLCSSQVVMQACIAVAHKFTISSELLQLSHHVGPKLFLLILGQELHAIASCYKFLGFLSEAAEGASWHPCPYGSCSPDMMHAIHINMIITLYQTPCYLSPFSHPHTDGTQGVQRFKTWPYRTSKWSSIVIHNLYMIGIRNMETIGSTQ